MENIDLGSIIQTLTSWVISIGGQVNDLPGGLAFALGLVTWFVVEQILRRILSWMRWIILIGVIVGLGFTLPYLLNQLIEMGGLPAIGGEQTQPSDIFNDGS